MYTSKKWFVPEDCPTTIRKKKNIDCWSEKLVTTEEVTNLKMTSGYKSYLNNVKPLEDMKKEYYTTKNSCQYQLVKYGEIDPIDVTRLESLKKRITQWLYRFKSISVEDAKEFWGWTEK